MSVRELLSLCVATVLMTVLIALVMYYVMPMPPDMLVLSAFIVTVVAVIGHEMVHRIYAVEFCHARSEFSVTYFAIVITLISIIIMIVLIALKLWCGWTIKLLPIIASPGAVYIAMRERSECYDNVAIAAPFYNFIVGIITLVWLYSVTQPPFVLNDPNNMLESVVAQISLFSFVFAFFNALPIKIGSVALDGYWALTVDRDDLVTKAITVIIIAVSFYVLFALDIWAVVV